MQEPFANENKKISRFYTGLAILAVVAGLALMLYMMLVKPTAEGAGFLIWAALSTIVGTGVLRRLHAVALNAKTVDEVGERWKQIPLFLRKAAAFLIILGVFVICEVHFFPSIVARLAHQGFSAASANAAGGFLIAIGVIGQLLMMMLSGSGYSLKRNFLALINTLKQQCKAVTWKVNLLALVGLLTPIAILIAAHFSPHFQLALLKPFLPHISPIGFVIMLIPIVCMTYVTHVLSQEPRAAKVQPSETYLYAGPVPHVPGLPDPRGTSSLSPSPESTPPVSPSGPRAVGNPLPTEKPTGATTEAAAQGGGMTDLSLGGLIAMD
jgi:hypothetical protein